MNDELFVINPEDLPSPLNKNQLKELFIKYQNGDKFARDRLVYCNMRLVISRVLLKFQGNSVDKKELISVGSLGLVNAIEHYDLSKNIEFSTYAIKCIDNKIFSYLNRNKKHEIVDSFEKEVNPRFIKSIKIGDLLKDDCDLLEDCIENERIRVIKEFIYNLPDREREIMIMNFGLDNHDIIKQVEIAQKFNITQPYVSILIGRIIKRIRIELQNQDLMERRSQKIKNTK